MITVVIVDDHPIVRAGMRAVLEQSGDILVQAEGGSGTEALRLVLKYDPDVLVLDINVPNKDGVEVTRQIKAQNLRTAILILTAHDDPQLIFGLLENGALGYVLKDEALETLAGAVRAVAEGKSWLSPAVASQVVRRAIAFQAEASPRSRALSAGHHLTEREVEVLSLLGQGLDNASIAKSLSITKRTVQNHISNIYGKLDLDSRAEAILYALQHGLAKVPDDP